MSFSENDKTFEFQNKVELPDCYAENYPIQNDMLFSAHWWRDLPNPTSDFQLSDKQNFLIAPFSLMDDYGICDDSNDGFGESIIPSEIDSGNPKDKICLEKNNEKEKSGLKKESKVPYKHKMNHITSVKLNDEKLCGVKGKAVAAKSMGPPCYCRLNCQDKIDEDERKNLHESYWRLFNWEERKEYITLCVVVSPKQRTRCRKEFNADRRQVTFTYTLRISNEFIKVCKAMFLSTFSVSEKFVRHAMLKKRNALGEGIVNSVKNVKTSNKAKKSEAVKDVVRDHIKSFTIRATSGNDVGKKYVDTRFNIAAMHKMYVQKCKNMNIPESDIVKQNYYRELFKSEFNLVLKSPLSINNTLQRDAQS